MNNKKETIDGTFIHEVSTEVAKKVFTKNKEQLLDDIKRTLDKRISDYFADKFGTKLVELEAKYGEIEKEYYYCKGKGVLTEEVEQRYRADIKNIEETKEDITRLKQIICD